MTREQMIDKAVRLTIPGSLQMWRGLGIPGKLTPLQIKDIRAGFHRIADQQRVRRGYHRHTYDMKTGLFQYCEKCEAIPTDLVAKG